MAMGEDEYEEDYEEGPEEHHVDHDEFEDDDDHPHLNRSSWYLLIKFKEFRFC